MLDQGVVAGLIWLSIITLVVIVAGICSLVTHHRSKEWETWGTIIFVIGGAVAFVSYVIAAVSLFPYQPKYWAWETKEGIVAEKAYDAKADTSNKDNRGGLRFRLGDGTTFFTRDFRLADANVGERVYLVCQPTYQNGNVDRVDCKSQIGAM